MLVLFRCFVVSDGVKVCINSPGPATKKQNVIALPRGSCRGVQLRSVASLSIRLKGSLHERVSTTAKARVLAAILGAASTISTPATTAKTKQRQVLCHKLRSAGSGDYHHSGHCPCRW